ncbi:MAG: hypothetical protein JO290_04165 [Sphingomonadaceae bacterium]|nr:hypothetical protein [Sphingomonadaceae bacterium]
MRNDTGGVAVKARSWWIILAVVVAAVLGGWTWLKHSRTGRRAELASGYVAHVVCSCRYVGNRDLKSCLTDYEPGLEIVRMSDDPAAKRITAWVPLLAKRTATYQGEYGCRLDER